MTAAAEEEASTAVRFTTRLEPRLRVAEAPIQLPTRLTRYGLSEVVNHLLGGQESRPFDFVLPEGELLRGSLGKYLRKAGLSGEDVVTLEYIELMAPPEPQSGAAHDDWVAAVASRTEEAGDEAGDEAVLLTGCYNGSAYVRDAAGTELAELRGHGGAVKGVAWLPPTAAGEDEGAGADADADAAAAAAAGEDASGGGGSARRRAVTASKDHTLRVWSVRRTADGWAAGCEAVCVGHDDAVEAVAASPAGGVFCSAGWDGILKLWDEARIGADGGAAAKPAAKPKRARRAAPDAAAAAGGAPAELEARAELRGHADCASGVAWPTAALLYSCSWDGTLKEWDVARAACAATLASGRAATCVDVSLLSALLASGHTDHVLRLWDARAPGAAQLSLRHKGWVGGVAWSRHRAHLLASACHDGTVRLWDTRSSVPLHELPPHADKALCVAWDGAERLLSGGADGELRALQLRLPAL